MASDFEIGRVVAVDTSQVTIELNRDLKALTLSTYEATVEVGRINSYVVIPVGARRVVAMVTRVVMTEEAELRTDKTMVALPSARRLMKATMIGTIDGKAFTQGISLFPVLDTPVLVATKEDLIAIFGGKEDPESTPTDGAGYCAPIGTSGIYPDYEIRIAPDTFFGKHAAIIGSTGSGKSCSIATIIQSILRIPSVRGTRFIILDMNGEYRTAFQTRREDGSWIDAYAGFRCLYIPTDPSTPEDNLVIPYWFMNSDDFVRLFRANVGLQAPILKRALGLARADSARRGHRNTTFEALLAALNRIRAHCENDAPNQQWAVPKNIKADCDDCLRFEGTFPPAWKELEDLGIAEHIKNGFEEIRQIAEEAASNNEGLGSTRIKRILDAIERIRAKLEDALTGPKGDDYAGQASPDDPVYFDLRKMVSSTIEIAMKEQAEASSPGRVREACGPMMIRIQRYLTDPRFEFLFGPVDGKWPEPFHGLATFLRDLLGMPPCDKDNILLSPEEELKKGLLPFYDRQRNKSREAYNVVIVDLSLLAAEVLENVTALIGRLILEFLQRVGEESVSGVERGSFPVVLVLEEAQNYIREPRSRDDESISRDVFERIAREGRKYGLGLVVASQRPSELSKTVLSQCSSFIVHRLQNPEDLRYFREIVPGIYNQLLDQLPALAPRTALVLGECVRAPALVYMREANPTPRSKDPKFWKRWIEKSPPVPDVEAVCRKWEGEDVGADHTERKSATGEQAVE